VTGELRREHWTVPVPGLTSAGPEGIVQATVHRDGTVALRLTCGDSRAEVRLDACRAAQLSTGIWEAAGAAQQLTAYFNGDQPPPSQRPNGPEDLLKAWLSPARRSAPNQDHFPGPRRRLSPVDGDNALDVRRTIGLRIRRIRGTRDKSLRIIAGLAGMSRSTLHRVEHGKRELTLSEIAALAIALNVAPAELIALPIRASTDN
jgi:DNA-binding Xre family transcriptional regulator